MPRLAGSTDTEIVTLTKSRAVPRTDYKEQAKTAVGKSDKESRLTHDEPKADGDARGDE